MCICQRCGRKYKIDLLIPDELWKRIKLPSEPVGGGLLCGSCIMELLERILDHSVFKLEKEGEPEC